MIAVAVNSHYSWLSLLVAFQQAFLCFFLAAELGVYRKVPQQNVMRFLMLVSTDNIIHYMCNVTTAVTMFVDDQLI